MCSALGDLRFVPEADIIITSAFATSRTKAEHLTRLPAGWARSAVHAPAWPCRRRSPHPARRSGSRVLREVSRSSSRCPASCSSPRRRPLVRSRDRSASADLRRHSRRAARSGRRSSCRADNSRCGHHKALRLDCSEQQNWISRHCRCRSLQLKDRGDRRP